MHKEPTFFDMYLRRGACEVSSRETLPLLRLPIRHVLLSYPLSAHI